MRRGGVLILLIGLIFIVGAGLVFFFLQGPTSIGGTPVEATELPTEVPLVEVVRARIDIQANTLISDTSQIEIVKISQDQFNADKDFSSLTDVLGKLAIRQILAEQPIEKADLTDPGLSQQIPTAEADRARDKAYPFIVNNLSGVADQIKPGDFVDVVATFNLLRRYSYPTGQTVEEIAGQQVPVLQRELSDPNFNATKTIVQRAQVIKIIRPQVAAPDSTPEPNADTPPQSSSLPQVDASGQPINPALGGGDTTGSITQGAWTLILAVDNQEIELMEFALATNSRMILVLRGAGDSTYEPTIGATFDLLVSEFGVPLPQNLPPNVISPDQAFTPEPTRTPAPTRVP
ncbi:pilus assembly protein CpaB [Oscillochloris sp. ZM17-4]|uniref:pilus assembly protein CpaB n=1 Tax=Oscillochloris sp. ZM17-4 TaxID=2866714 RepID=UPI001C729DB3|nr:pilus assembly protein CpaB [Oscillochloris sp. ZM17-4]MBX0327613.1 pilus assembly protein CpaB [Oscillochloris sp. ZM17-4]